MFSTFTIKETGLGTGVQVVSEQPPPRFLIIRSEDIRRFEDKHDSNCQIAWVENGEMVFAIVQGTARENLERLRNEELAAIDSAQRAQQRQASGMPVVPVPRGLKR